MAKKVSAVQKLGSWAFIVGILIAIIAGFWPLDAIMTSVLIVLGLVVGLLNVTAAETTPFLLATVSLVIVSSLGGDVIKNVAVVGPTLQNVLSAMIVFIIPATIIVALKAIYALAATE